MATQSEVNKKLLDAQLSALVNASITPKEVAYLTKAIMDTQKIVDQDTGLSVYDPTRPYGVVWVTLYQQYSNK
jgi:thymidine phosphorylase